VGIKYRVTLTDAERAELERLITVGRTAAYRIRHANILLALDDRPENARWTDRKIAEAYQCTEKTVGTLRKKFVKEGFERALERKRREKPPRVKIDGPTEAAIVALAREAAPQGHHRWTLRLLADKAVERGILDSISHTAIGGILKKKRDN
jgi:transposase